MADPELSCIHLHFFLFAGQVQGLSAGQFQDPAPQQLFISALQGEPFSSEGLLAKHGRWGGRLHTGQAGDGQPGHGRA